MFFIVIWQTKAAHNKNINNCRIPEHHLREDTVSFPLIDNLNATIFHRARLIHSRLAAALNSQSNPCNLFLNE